MGSDRGGMTERLVGREGAAASLVYPVLSRRSGGLSVGVNLFDSGKACSFDCPYCEVFSAAARDGADSRPSSRGAPSSPDPVLISRLEAELSDFFDREWGAAWAPSPVRDICFSGDGEPTLSPSLEAAIAACARARRERPALLGSSKLVLITNSTGFLDPGISSMLERAVDEAGLEIWAKLDAGGEELFRLMSGSAFSLERVAEGILSFARRRPIVVQSMLCEVRGRVPAERDARELGARLASLAGRGARFIEVHAYTFARPTPGGGCGALADDRLAELAREIAASSALAVRAFGARGELGGANGPQDANGPQGADAAPGGPGPSSRERRW
jgi:wyosine [tRNA(Phe)-imidazoG37] synthetase (radical SAM superfamily)